MGKFIIKYETFSKDVVTKEIMAYSKHDVISKIHDCKEIYWIEDANKVSDEDLNTVGFNHL